MVKTIVDFGVPDEINLGEFEKFISGMKEVRKTIKEIAIRQGENRFIAKNKVKIANDKWERIYEIIQDSDNRISYSKHTNEITSKYIGKLLMIFGDIEIVTLIIVLTLSGLLSISSNQVNNIELDAFEKELKVFDITPGSLRQSIIDNGGEIKYQGLLIDNNFDRRKGLLEKNGDIKLRIRTRKLVDDVMTQSFIPKRKIDSSDQSIFSQLQGYLDSMELDIDLSELRRDQGEMKIALEEEEHIHDRAAIEMIFEEGLNMRLVKAKVKLRSSLLLDGAKIEIEKYPGIKDGTGVNKWMPHFAEIEAPNMELTQHILEKLGIDNLDTSTGGSKDVFSRYEATGGYLDFRGKKPKDVISELLRRDRIINQAEIMMERGYFYTY